MTEEIEGINKEQPDEEQPEPVEETFTLYLDQDGSNTIVIKPSTLSTRSTPFSAEQVASCSMPSFTLHKKKLDNMSQRQKEKHHKCTALDTISKINSFHLMEHRISALTAACIFLRDVLDESITHEDVPDDLRDVIFNKTI